MTVKQYQNDPLAEYLRKVAYAESGNNPNAKNPNGSASGKFQFIDSSWKYLSDKYNLGYSLQDRFDPAKSEKVMRLFTTENEKAIRPVLGRDLNDADRYMTHFLGTGGASKFFKIYQGNPNAPISDVMSPQALQANKNVAYNKDGSLKTVAQVYDWANKKMQLTPETINQGFTNYEPSLKTPTFETSPVDLQQLPEQPQQEEVTQAKETLKQQTSEFNFLKDLQAFQTKPVQQVQMEQQQAQIAPIDVLQQYQEVSQFVQTPTFQQGGQIPISSNGVYDYPQQKVIVPSGNITMKNVDYPILGKSLETGEQKIMMPNLNYLFNNTKNVLETPIL